MVKSTLNRIGNILSSSVNDALDRLEDPHKQVRQLVRDMEAAVDDAISAVGTAIADERRLARRHEEEKRQVQRLEELASRAMERGEEDLARGMTERRVMLEQASTAAALAESRDTVASLKIQLSQMRANVQQARDRQGSVIARLQAAKSMPGWPPPSSLSTQDPFTAFQQLACKVDRSREELEQLGAELEIGEGTSSGLDVDPSAQARAFERQADDLELKRRIDEEMDLLQQKVKT